MARVLITGMSGAGKSTALLELQRRGHLVVDTDYGNWKELISEHEEIWREDRMIQLLTNHTTGTLFVSGCESNQGKFYAQFEAVVLLTAPLEVLFERIETRETNNFGKVLKNALESWQILKRLNLCSEKHRRMSLTPTARFRMLWINSS